MIKRLFFLSTIASAIGLPYVLSTSSEWWSSLRGQFASTAQQAPAPSAPADGASSFGQRAATADRGPSPAAGDPAKALPLEGYGTHDLAEVLHFDATPGWVMARWPRVTIGLADLDLQGYRVPLVTGTAENDLAGSLTYYFDEQQQVRFIHFRGTTGDPRKLVALVMSRYRLQPQATGDPGLLLYQVKWNGKPMSELQVRTAHVIRATQPHTRYQVELALKRP